MARVDAQRVLAMRVGQALAGFTMHFVLDVAHGLLSLIAPIVCDQPARALGDEFAKVENYQPDDGAGAESETPSEVDR